MAFQPERALTCKLPPRKNFTGVIRPSWSKLDNIGRTFLMRELTIQYGSIQEVFDALQIRSKEAASFVRTYIQDKKESDQAKQVAEQWGRGQPVPLGIEDDIPQQRLVHVTATSIVPACDYLDFMGHQEHKPALAKWIGKSVTWPPFVNVASFKNRKLSTTVDSNLPNPSPTPKLSMHIGELFGDTRAVVGLLSTFEISRDWEPNAHLSFLELPLGSVAFGPHGYKKLPSAGRYYICWPSDDTFDTQHNELVLARNVTEEQKALAPESCVADPTIMFKTAFPDEWFPEINSKAPFHSEDEPEGPSKEVTDPELEILGYTWPDHIIQFRLPPNYTIVGPEGHQVTFDPILYETSNAAGNLQGVGGTYVVVPYERPLPANFDLNGLPDHVVLRLDISEKMVVIRNAMVLPRVVGPGVHEWRTKDGFLDLYGPRGCYNVIGTEGVYNIHEHATGPNQEDPIVADDDDESAREPSPTREAHIAADNGEEFSRVLLEIEETREWLKPHREWSDHEEAEEEEREAQRKAREAEEKERDVEREAREAEEKEREVERKARGAEEKEREAEEKRQEEALEADIERREFLLRKAANCRARRAALKEAARKAEIERRAFPDRNAAICRARRAALRAALKEGETRQDGALPEEKPQGMATRASLHAAAHEDTAIAQSLPLRPTNTKQSADEQLSTAPSKVQSHDIQPQHTAADPEQMPPRGIPSSVPAAESFKTYPPHNTKNKSTPTKTNTNNKSRMQLRSNTNTNPSSMQPQDTTAKPTNMHSQDTAAGPNSIQPRDTLAGSSSMQPRDELAGPSSMQPRGTLTSPNPLPPSGIPFGISAEEWRMMYPPRDDRNEDNKSEKRNKKARTTTAEPSNMQLQDFFVEPSGMISRGTQTDDTITYPTRMISRGTQTDDTITYPTQMISRGTQTDATIKNPTQMHSRGTEVQSTVTNPNQMHPSRGAQSADHTTKPSNVQHQNTNAESRNVVPRKPLPGIITIMGPHGIVWKGQAEDYLKMKDPPGLALKEDETAAKPTALGYITKEQSKKIEGTLPTTYTGIKELCARTDLVTPVSSNGLTQFENDTRTDLKNGIRIYLQNAFPVPTTPTPAHNSTARGPRARAPRVRAPRVRAQRRKRNDDSEDEEYKPPRARASRPRPSRARNPQPTQPQSQTVASGPSTAPHGVIPPSPVTTEFRGPQPPPN
ncbi:hypothetical protein F5Y19DRAFT_483808 [Xylariaceae sp. FL1651]|nr:hypothetical protein F5Y19DRAFT_483808 [Xylariaceae sp. FL1651]